MNVADLAAELEVPASMILDQCQRFGIDASWAGAELGGADVVLLRAELASSDPIDLRPADDPVADGEPPSDPDGSPADGADGAAASLPPTAVGSMPELIDEVTPEGDPLAPPAGGESPHSRGPGFAMAGAEGVSPTTTRRVGPRPAPTKRRLERGARNSIIALVVAVAAFVGSNFTELPALVFLLWLVTIVALCVAVVDGVRGRRRVQTHPERLSGLWLATISLILAIAGIIGLTASVVGAVGDDPAADAPMGVGDLQSVQTARWGYQRVQRYSKNGWSQPARSEGTCWEVNARKQRDEDRVEIAEETDLTKCDRVHTMEVARVFAYDRDADSRYPTMPQFVKAADARCGPTYERLVDKGVKVEMQIEVPTEIGWGNGDHDVACVLLTEKRTEPLVS